jgi:GT2 family glycosyltransferase
VGFDRIFPRSRIIGGYNATFVAEDEVADVGAVVGAFMLVRRSVLDKTGYFDEQFFMYGEDIDLCYRCTQIGARVVYLPRYKIRHHKGIASGIKEHSAKQSTAALAVRLRMVREFHDSMLIFYNKHQRGCHGWPINLLVRSGVYARRWVAVRRVKRGKGSR